MAITDSLDNAATAVANLATQISGERAAVLASIPAEAQPTDILAATAHNLFISPADFFAALESGGIYNSALGQALTQLLGARVLVNPYRPVYVDPVNGNDANDGLTSGDPVKTVEHAVTLGGAGQSINIYLMGDVTISGAVVAICPIVGFQPYGASRRTITLTTGNLIFNGNVYVTMIMNTTTLIYLKNCDIHMGPLPATFNGAPVYGMIWSIDGSFNTTGCTFTRDPACGATLFNTSSRTQFDIFASTFSGSWPGNIFAGVAAGVNPNNYWNYTTNLTSA